MPSYDSCTLCNSRSNRINIFILGIVCIGVGLSLMFFVKKTAKPFAESISDHPLKVLGIVLVIIGGVFSVMICVQCWIMNETSPSSLSQVTVISGRSPNQTTDWSVPTSTRTQHLTTDSTNRFGDYSSNQPYVLSVPPQNATSVASIPKPIDLDLPPSYEEVMGNINRPVS